MTDHEEGSIRARWVESRFECANSTRGNCAFVSAGLKSQLHRDFQSELRRERALIRGTPLSRLRLRLHAARGRPPGSAQDPAIGRRR